MMELQSKTDEEKKRERRDWRDASLDVPFFHA